MKSTQENYKTTICACSESSYSQSGPSFTSSQAKMPEKILIIFLEILAFFYYRAFFFLPVCLKLTKTHQNSPKLTKKRRCFDKAPSKTQIEYSGFSPSFSNPICVMANLSSFATAPKSSNKNHLKFEITHLFKTTDVEVQKKTVAAHWYAYLVYAYKVKCKF